MTGTSIDSLDAALVEVRGRGLNMAVRFLRGLTRPLGDLAPVLRRLAGQHPMTAGEISRIARDFALLHTEALRDLLGHDHADLIAIHGQTVFHAPPASWQLFSPAPVALALGAPVVCDLRAADLAAGGQGAPITPLADWVLFRRTVEPPACTAIVNLGGYCNVTLLPPLRSQCPVEAPGRTYDTPLSVRPGLQHVSVKPTDETAAAEIQGIEGFDVCACNQLLDHIARELLDSPYDEDGRCALRGEPNPAALEDLIGVLRSQAGAKRSLGTGDEGAAWLARWRTHVRADDLAATACEAIGAVVSERIRSAGLTLLAGGGARNGALAGAIASHASCRVEPLGSRGVPIEYREAACMAALGALCQDGVPITLPQVTGVPSPAPVAGIWSYPPARPHRP